MICHSGLNKKRTPQAVSLFRNLLSRVRFTKQIKEDPMFKGALLSYRFVFPACIHKRIRVLMVCGLRRMLLVALCICFVYNKCVGGKPAKAQAVSGGVQHTLFNSAIMNTDVCCRNL